MHPPRDEAEMMQRARALAGRTVQEAAHDVGLAVPATTLRGKGFVGQLAELVLGTSAGSAAEPDFLELGVELKTLPIANGKPKESTFVCSIRLNEMEDTAFEDSVLWHKLARVLWLPIEADPEVALAHRRFGAAIVWSPNADERAVLQADYERIATLVLRGEVDRITGHLGTYVQVRPKAAHGSVRERAPGGDGYQWTGPRGFYLRPKFTKRVLTRLR